MVELTGLDDVWMNDGLMVNSLQQPIGRDHVILHQDLFAVGDLVHMPSSPSSLWFQMRLWAQAEIMGRAAAYAMTSTPHDYDLDLFSHVTVFGCHKVYLLGRYNGQGLTNSHYCQLLAAKPDGIDSVTLSLNHDKSSRISRYSLDDSDEQSIEMAIRLTPDVEYIKLIGKKEGTRQIVIGAMVISKMDQDLDEVLAFIGTIENIMLSQIDVSAIGGICELLSQNVDIEDYFD